MLEKTIALGKELSKKEMRNLNGGGTCCAHSNTMSQAAIVFGEQWDWQCGLSKSEAISTANDAAAAGTPSSWCCSSCSQSSYSYSY